MMRALVLATALALAGCAGGTINEAQTRITETAVADLRGALASAEAFGDEQGAQCWSGLLTVAEKAGIHTTEVIGAATAYQKARNARKLIQEAGETFKDSCARLYMDAPAPVRLLIDRIGVARAAVRAVL
jgi:hypothetical protein